MLAEIELHDDEIEGGRLGFVAEVRYRRRANQAYVARFLFHFGNYEGDLWVLSNSDRSAKLEIQEGLC
ncbi:hypothetical protein PAXRUDRAFT_823168 [Paxillus rubicundulus Ve08.2h10]|uniref:Unplaced genomic scaffold scaffold_49, whole genome shotgun sequence n=1 Tax=Paxillus rubicundulus Ve08.2h10 TaxID=930991 RepID=A0A0D0E927_9AGAM|nr:hypothetical protein PAXRUDRAFT_823168 [Paxillus rubicundulus Ve08.2h10]